MNAEPKVKSWTTEKDGEKTVHVQIERLEPSAFFAGGCGKTYAEALMRAAVTLYNRECQEFNRRERDLEKADKDNYRILPEKRYRARRRSPVILTTCDEALDMTLFYSQMKITCENMMRTVGDAKFLFECMKNDEKAVPFMVE